MILVPGCNDWCYNAEFAVKQKHQEYQRVFNLLSGQSEYTLSALFCIIVLPFVNYLEFCANEQLLVEFRKQYMVLYL